MPYQRQFWVDRLVNTETGETIQDGTRFTARRMNHIEEGIRTSMTLSSGWKIAFSPARQDHDWRQDCRK
ncbi:hypothetical protein ACFSND_04010 [Brevibacillus brevis]|uniref:hypothetical protein n=1 Tax=Brevibacillus brevis TaxID=1393 RepID=UPI00363D9D10